MKLIDKLFSKPKENKLIKTSKPKVKEPETVTVFSCFNSVKLVLNFSHSSDLLI